jgi:hypothetical protein
MRFGGTSANPAGDSASLLASLVASVDSTRGQTDPRLLKQLAQCFNALAAEVETGASTQAMGADLAERLKAVLPAQRVRLARDAEGDRTPMPGSETIYFDVPGSAGSHSRLEIDFPSDCRLERWHLQLLRCAAQLTGVIADVDRLRSFEREGGTSLQAPPLEPRLDTPPGWERLVVRYVDGRMLKGYAKAFIPSRGYVNVSPRPDAPAESAVSVPLAQLKAIFFVHDLNRLPDDAPQTLGCTGRRVEVTFSDGEVLRGATLNYTSTGRGFFVWPEDRRTNNIRAFVVRSAVRRAQLL